MKYGILISTFIMALGSLTACVSIDLSENEIQKATNVRFQAPNSKVFKSISSENIDHGWRNNKNGNTITFISDCGNPYDPSLESIEAGIVSGLQDLKRISTEKPMYNSRASRNSVYTGNVDGIASKVELIVFKKNNCIYVLSYLAVDKYFAENHQDFKNFTEGFRTP